MALLEKWSAVFTDKAPADMPDYFAWWKEREYKW